jgi:CheY-like chemotaxis protein
MVRVKVPRFVELHPCPTVFPNYKLWLAQPLSVSMSLTPSELAVLVVDDQPNVRATAVDMFQALGMTVYDAYNGRDALNLLVAHPEIVLLFADVRMPGMTGDELAREAQLVRPDLKIVLTSGYVDGVSLPNVPFLRKPYRVSDLAALVRGHGEGQA